VLWHPAKAFVKESFMSTLPRVLTLAAIGAASSWFGAQAAGTVEVKYLEPTKFSDAGRSSWDIERTTAAFSEHFKALGKELPDGQTLRLSVTDIDLAGELRPGRHGNDIRILRGRADWPRVGMNYELVQGERAVKTGKVQVADMAYQQNSLGARQSEAFAYEFRMLDRWFNEEILNKAKR
jgi:Protein of unknown function (DUF3016)